jgi:hypothetical protein
MEIRPCRDWPALVGPRRKTKPAAGAKRKTVSADGQGTKSHFAVRLSFNIPAFPLADLPEPFRLLFFRCLAFAQEVQFLAPNDGKAAYANLIANLANLRGNKFDSVSLHGWKMSME